MPRIDVESYEDDWEDAERAETPRSRKLSVAARKRIDDFDTARVVAVDRGRVLVALEDRFVEAAFAGTMRGTKAAVGDRVRIRPRRHDTDVARVVEVLPRSSALIRTGDDDSADERVVVANADLAVVVIAADHLVAGTRLLDRVMVAASAGGLATAVCINKVDLVGDRAAVTDVLERYATLDVAGTATSAVTGEGIGSLEALLGDRWSAFAGHSGVGKSSLYNRLIPEADQVIGAMGRFGGRHTTVAARALRVERLDAWLVDTPGVRSFGLGGVDARDLARHFPELATLSCRLDDCVHDGEPGCTIAAAPIHPDRLASYRRLLAAVRARD